MLYVLNHGVIELVLFLFLAFTAILVARQRDLFAAAMLTGVYSLVSAGALTVMDAVDVAFTEAAVGAGMGTVLILATLALTGHQERRPRRLKRQRHVMALSVVTLTGAALVYGTLDMPGYGAPDAPVHHYLANTYIQRIPADIAVPNFVTAILASYRGFDTFGELAVVFTAGVGVTMLLARKKHHEVTRKGVSTSSPNEDAHITHPHQKVREMPVLRTTTKLLLPVVLLFALYVQAHGDFGPGGGFQAGVIFASALIMYGLTFGRQSFSSNFSATLIEFASAFGVLCYGGVGIASMLRGGNFLDYNVLLHDAVHGQHFGIFLVELGVGITVTAVMLLIYARFTARGAHD